MWQKQNKDNRIFRLAVASLLASNAVIILSVTVIEFTRAESTHISTTFELPKNVPMGTKVRIYSSSSMNAINKALQSNFEKQFSGIEIEMTSSHMNMAIKAVLDGKADIAAINHKLTPEEKAQGLEQIVLHEDKIAVVVGKNNPFQGDLTIELFAKIFQGQITSWSELGDYPGKIRLIDHPTKTNIRQALFNHPIFKKSKFSISTNNTNYSIADNTEQIINQLGKDGISYLLNKQVANISAVRVLSLHTIQLDNPKYISFLPSVYIYKRNSSVVANTFLKFITSKLGQDTIQTAINHDSYINTQKVSIRNKTIKKSYSDEVSLESQNSVTLNTGVNTQTNTRYDSSKNRIINSDADKIINVKIPNDDGKSITESITNNIIDNVSKFGDFGWLWQLLLGGLGVLSVLYILGKKTSSKVKPEITSELPGPGNTYNDNYDQISNIKSSQENIADNVSGLHSYTLDLEAPVAVVNPSYPSPYGKQEILSTESHYGQTGSIANLVTGAAIPLDTNGMAQIPITKDKDIQEPRQKFSSETLDMIADAAEPSLMRNSIDSKISLHLIPESQRVARATWRGSQQNGTDQNKQGDEQFILRLYDVTDIDLSYQSPKLIKQNQCKQGDNNLFVDIPLSGRNYMAELGYLHDGDVWFAMANSNIIRVFSTFVGESLANKTNTNLRIKKGMAASTTAGLIPATVDSSSLLRSTTKNDSGGNIYEYPKPPIQDGESSIILVNRTSKWAYASWNVSASQQTELQYQGAKQLSLRLYDVTDIDLSYQEPKLTQQYECDQTTNDRFVAIPNSDRNYMAEIGYTTDEKQWLLLARSSTIRVFSRQGESLWLVADAELLIHGATEPDTKVTVGDYHIKTRPDGTFHLRIPFTDNLIDCIMKAQDSNNGIVKIIHKQFYSDFLDIDGMSH